MKKYEEFLMHNFSFRNAYNTGSFTNNNGKTTLTYQESYSCKHCLKCDTDLTRHLFRVPFHFSIHLWPCR